MQKRTTIAVLLAFVGSTAVWSSTTMEDCAKLTPETVGAGKKSIECVPLLLKSISDLAMRVDELEATNRVNPPVSNGTERVEYLEAKMLMLIDPNSGKPKLATDHQHNSTSLASTDLPSGAVVPFDLANQCPDGWRPFVDGQNRVILGASFGLPDQLFRGRQMLTQRKYRDHGGVEEISLQEHHIGDHSHEVTYGTQDVLTLDTTGNRTKSSRVGAVYTVEYKTSGGNPVSPLFAQPRGKGTPINNMPPYIALYFCKKD